MRAHGVIKFTGGRRQTIVGDPYLDEASPFKQRSHSLLDNPKDGKEYYQASGIGGGATQRTAASI